MRGCFGDGDSWFSDSPNERSPAPPNHTMLSGFGGTLAATLQRISPAMSAACARAMRTTFRQKPKEARHELRELSRMSSSIVIGSEKSCAIGRLMAHSRRLAAAEKRRQAAALQSALSRAKTFVKIREIRVFLSCEFVELVSHFDSAFVAMPSLVIPARCTASIKPINFCTGKSRSGRMTIATSGFFCLNSPNCAVSVSKSIT